MKKILSYFCSDVVNTKARRLDKELIQMFIA